VNFGQVEKVQEPEPQPLDLHDSAYDAGSGVWCGAARQPDFGPSLWPAEILNLQDLVSLYQAIKGMGGWLSRLIFDCHQVQPHVYSVRAACRTNPIHLISGVQKWQAISYPKGLGY
jgi:hypothetical protein